ncbi:hypothetical protein J14TS5_20180 [Paenibacillus lautus]|nr:hypothetical protein J14TS5_20180 [Paenibacillus lautus]
MKAGCQAGLLTCGNQPFYGHVKVEYKNSLLTQTLRKNGTVFRVKGKSRVKPHTGGYLYGATARDGRVYVHLGCRDDN